VSKRITLMTALSMVFASVIFASLLSARESDSLTVRQTVDEQDKRYQLQGLRERLQALEKQLDAVRERSQAVASQQHANVFNPGITIFGNFVGRWDDAPVFLEEAEGDGKAPRVDDKFNLREVELDFRGAIDPWADGVVIAAFESEVPGEFTTEIEEGYFTLKRLPVIDRAPLGLKLKAGRYRPEFGRQNKIHTHDLPWMTRPRAYQTFLGDEGFIRNGVSAGFFIPTPGEGNTLEAAADVVNDGGLPYSVGAPAAKGGYLGHLKWFWDIADGHDLEIGGSGYIEDTSQGTFASRLYGIDVTYKWKPFRGGARRSFHLGGELFVADLPDAIRQDDRPLGFYTWAQYQFGRQLYIGARYDYTEVFAEDESQDEGSELNTLGAYLTYYTTEFLRFRVALEHAGKEIGKNPNLNTVFVEVNFLFGSHPVEPYWVNR